ncbi:MAG TPA: secretin and TonB N-terminal domain-containing protein [Tepidisphaeraceae bacterium]|nr:secretin and TonB N-terminal domain-containing protein [Tepidisphaeraceae bacterium]
MAAVEGGATPQPRSAQQLASQGKAIVPAAARVLAAADTGSDVKILDDGKDPFAAATGSDPLAAAAPTTAPSTQPTDGTLVDAGTAPVDGAATTQPSEGRSVSSSEVSVNDAGTVEIHVNDANLVEVLRMLSLQSQKNIVASKDVRGTITANLYDVTVREALDAILHANGYAYREKGNFIYVYTAREIAEIEKSERQMRTEVFRVFYTPALNAANMIKPVLSKGGGEVAVTTPAKAGIGSSPAGGGGNDHAGDDVLVVTDYPENLDAVRRILSEVDRRPQQILLEATILRATLNEDNALGVDFNILGGVDFNALSVNNGQIGGANAVPDATGGIPGDGRVHSVGTGNSFTSPINNGLKVGFVTSSVSMFVSALEQVTDTTILANPKVLALNKQQGEVFVGNEDGYYTTLTTETTTSQSVESLKTGTRLLFRPYVGNDGYVRLEVHPEDSDGQVKANGLPSKNTTEVTSNVMVKDGHTIVIGGLFRESSTSAKSQVPFLGNIPVAGLLFKNQRDRTVREEVIILLTPHIIKDDVSYSRLSEEELKRAESLRVGVRKGMMPWGRERMAEGWYEAAKKELAKPNPNRSHAKFCLDAATNLNPKFSEAIQLKEEITGHEVTSAYGGSVRTFVRRAMLSDVAPATQPTTTLTGAPSTQPSPAVAAAPATQPSGEPTAAAVPAPATQPGGEEFAGTETAMVPVTEEWVEKDLAPAMVGTAEASTVEGITEAPAATQPATQPASQPATTEDVSVGGPAVRSEQNALEVTGESTVTVLPLEDAPTEAPSPLEGAAGAEEAQK